MLAEIALLDLDTLMAVKKAAPRVTGVSFGQAREVVNAMQKHQRTILKGADDGEGHVYYTATLKDLHAITGMEIKLIGRACREMGLTAWRKTDGYHVAWSSEQLSILEKYFKVNT